MIIRYINLKFVHGSYMLYIDIIFLEIIFIFQRLTDQLFSSLLSFTSSKMDFSEKLIN